MSWIAVPLSGGGRVRVRRVREVVVVHFDVVQLSQFVEGGLCLTCGVSEAAGLRDALGDALEGPRSRVAEEVS
jgi:hypothetical protein